MRKQLKAGSKSMPSGCYLSRTVSDKIFRPQIKVENGTMVSLVEIACGCPHSI